MFALTKGNSFYIMSTLFSLKAWALKNASLFHWIFEIGWLQKCRGHRKFGRQNL